MISDAESYIDNNIFLQIEKSDSKTLFFYGIVIIILLSIFQYLSIGTNILIAFFLAILIIVYFNSKNQYTEKSNKEIYDNKVDLIKPKPKRIQNYPKLVDFIFSIQDFYLYNIPAYEQMIDSIDNILELYEETKINYSVAGINYNLIDSERKEAVNNLHSIIYNIPSNTFMLNKLNSTIDELNNLLYEILDEIYTYYKLYIYNNGYNRGTIEIIRGPKPENFYNNEPYSFDIY